MNILNKFKRGLAGLLSLSVAVSAVFVFHFPLIKAYAAEEHTNHCFCGKSNCDDEEHESVDWEPLPMPTNSTDATEETEGSGLPTEGCFYLTSDITLKETWTISGELTLCLNGKSIIMDGDGDVISVAYKGEFTLCDCKNEGVIKHTNGKTGSGVYNDDTFYMYGGTISDNSATEGGGVYNCDSSEFYMYGGFITDNESTGNGGGVNNAGEFNMYKGTISNNTADSNGGGVYNEYSRYFSMYGGKITGNTAVGNGAGVYNDGDMTVGGNVNITGNTSSGKDNNVYLTEGKVIDISDSDNVPLRGKSTMIGVTTEVAPTKDDDDYLHDVDIAKSTDGENYRLFFASDEKFNTSYVDGNSEGTIVFTLGESDDNEVEPKKPEDSEPDTSEPEESDNSSESSNSESSDSSSSDSSDSNSSEESSNPGTEPIKPTTHSHGVNDGITWTAFDEENPQTEKGNYYLAGEGDEVVLNDTWTPADGTRLCLNSKKLIINKNAPAISVTGSFTLCDDEGGGIVTHGENGGVGVSVANTGRFAIYSGTIDGNKGYGVTIENGGALTVGGTAKITDEVYLRDGQYITIDENKSLEDGAEIYVKTATDPTAAEGETPAVNIPITNASGDDYSEFFHSNTSDYIFINETTTDGDVVYLAVKTPENQKHKHGDVELTEWTATDRLPDTAGNYYLADNVTLSSAWQPKAGTYLCLNGKTITGTISVTNPNFTLCSCKSSGTANVTVSADKTITVGGKLNANITLNDGAKIDVDSNYPLTTGASITVALGKALADGESKEITTANGGAYSIYFKSANSSYTKKIVGGEVVFEKPEKQDPPVIGHTDHPICGDIKCTEHSDPKGWTEWTYTTSLPTDAGSYYLANNVTLTSQWKPTSNINLCLNGYTITMNGNDTAVYVTKDLSICDCSVKMLGTITHASGKTGRGVYIASGGAFTMYGGNIKGNTTSADGAGVYNDGTFDMLGGEITGNKTTGGSGGGLYNKGFAQIEGSINKNSAYKKGGGVYQDGKLTVDGDAYIMYNTVGSSKSNVYITDGSWITIGSKYVGEVGVSLETYPKTSGSTTFAKGSISSSTVNKLKSDSSSYKIAKSGDKLTLAKKSTTSSDDSDLELEISSPLASSAIPSADRTAIINLLKDMPSWVVGAYYDVTLWEDDEEIDDAGESLTVKLTIPASIRATNREYKVIRVHDGKATVLDGTTDSSKTTITVKSRYFSTYAIIYSVSQSGVGSSGSGSNGGYVNPAMGVQNDIPLAGLACGFTVLALAAPGKKLDQ